MIQKDNHNYNILVDNYLKYIPRLYGNFKLTYNLVYTILII